MKRSSGAGEACAASRSPARRGHGGGDAVVGLAGVCDLDRIAHADLHSGRRDAQPGAVSAAWAKMRKATNTRYTPANAFRVRFSCPPSVTTTSSSMRTPPYLRKLSTFGQSMNFALSLFFKSASSGSMK